MKKFIKTVGVILSFLIVLSCFSVSFASAAGGLYSFYYSNGEARITRCQTYAVGKVEIPSTYTLSNSLFVCIDEECDYENPVRQYVCPDCGSFMQGVGNCSVICCGKQVEALKINKPDDEHMIKVSEIEDDFYIEFNHEMTKEHYIGFVAYVRFDRVLTVRLYPEQDATVRFPKMYGGKLYYYCNTHGLFELKI